MKDIKLSLEKISFKAELTVQDENDIQTDYYLSATFDMLEKKFKNFNIKISS